MAVVRIWGSLQAATGGRAEVEVEASTIRQMLDALEEAHPGLGPQLRRGVSVSVDGAIYNDSWFAPIRPGSEVVLLPRLPGG